MLGLLGLLFAAAKLHGDIAWSWWLVLLPIYGPYAVALSLMGVAFAATVVAALLD